MHNVVLEDMFKMCNFFTVHSRNLRGLRLSKMSDLFQIGYTIGQLAGVGVSLLAVALSKLIGAR